MFTKSPRKNNLTVENVPTTIVLKIKLERIEDFNEEKHELKMAVGVTYLWIDERIETNKTMRLNFNTLKDSEFWRPGFAFRNARAVGSDHETSIIFKNQVTNYRA